MNQLQEFVSAFTWKDALDFGLLFIIVYGALRVVKGTRAVPVLLAVAAFGFIAWAVNALDLIASASLLKYFFESIIILLIVVFQAELRRLLLYLGQRLLPASRREAAKSAVGELVSALDRLQRARIGALVILQGDLPVMEIATGKGAEVDAPLRAETLVALAIPHAANTAHDGAVLIEDFKITRAGVICPLTEQQLDPRFGTRHRGAIGCTEESDALALVLSEERGELRIAQGRAISDPIEVTDLEDRITEWLAAPRETWTRKPEEDEAPGDTGARADVTRTQMKRADVSASSSALEKKVKTAKPVEEAQ